MTRLSMRLTCRERGATAVEYGIMLALIAGVLLAAGLTIGPKLVPGFQAVIDGI